MGQFQRLVIAVGLVFNVASIDHASAHIVARGGTKCSSSKNPFTPEFAKFVQDNMDFWKIPGIAIAVVDGQNVFSKGYGFSALPNTKVTPDTLFYAGSTTKAQTAACLSSLIQNGSYKSLAQGWLTPISSILKDDFVLQDQWATDHLTLEDAVSHRTGIPRHDRSLMREKGGVPLSLKDIVRNLRNLPIPNEPRTKFRYSNYMYITLSHVIETVTKKKLKQVMREMIWDPLGMKSTYFGLQEANKALGKLATGYIWIDQFQNHSPAAYMPLTDLSGAAAVISNVRDYAKWIQSLLNQTQLFSESVHQDILTPRMIQYPLPSNNFDVTLYGLGWYRATLGGLVAYRHDGEIIGFGAQVYLFPDDEFGFVIFANDDSASTVNALISRKLIADKFNIPENDILDVAARFVSSQSWQDHRSSITTSDELFKAAINRTYPSRPKGQVNPSSFNMSDLEGTYCNRGYGNMTLRVGASKPGDKTLIAELPEMTWSYGLTFRHIFGDNWMACESWLEDMLHPGVFHGVEFVKGHDGKPAALTIKWTAGDEIEGNITYTKMRK
ncbi:Beta-lactamase/transpeptidase-like protein [Tolypocladium paradoxum]|uniref:Beta-lactamase/transpeptidase-like protein n=1 Tax=Tolypocladium paradoxum TaxID=94208 RepID=A0A2S4L084_9HYPO|nr:Beta-lactamase/transpeptidase-like protein [Tolypocladium paradoxum]